jgi:hypothetical protein
MTGDHQGRTSEKATLQVRATDEILGTRSGTAGMMSERILPDTLDVDDFLEFESLKEVIPRPAFDPGPLGIPEPMPDPAAFQPPPLGTAQRLVPGAKQRYAARFEAGRREYESAVQAHGSERPKGW